MAQEIQIGLTISVKEPSIRVMDEKLKKEEIPKEIDIQYDFDPSYRIVAANGVYGGITPRGDMKIDFFVESLDVPHQVRNKVLPDGKLGEEISRSPGKRLVRRLQVGLILSINDAGRIADFIKQRIELVKAKAKE